MVHRNLYYFTSEFSSSKTRFSPSFDFLVTKKPNLFSHVFLFFPIQKQDPKIPCPLRFSQLIWMIDQALEPFPNAIFCTAPVIGGWFFPRWRLTSRLASGWNGSNWMNLTMGCFKGAENLYINLKKGGEVVQGLPQQKPANMGFLVISPYSGDLCQPTYRG